MGKLSANAFLADSLSKSSQLVNYKIKKCGASRETRTLTPYGTRAKDSTCPVTPNRKKKRRETGRSCATDFKSAFPSPAGNSLPTEENQEERKEAQGVGRPSPAALGCRFLDAVIALEIVWAYIELMHL